MGTDDRRALQDLLAVRARSLSKEAIESHGQISDEDVESLQSLARLIEIRNAAPARKRGAVILLLLGTLLAVSVLVFVPVRTAEIELDLEVSELSFTLPADQPITAALGVAWVGVSGIERIEMPRTLDREPNSYTEESILLRSEQIANRTTAITLDGLTLPAGTRIWLRATGLPHEFRLSFSDATTEFGISLQGPVTVVVPGVMSERLEFPYPRQITLQAESQVVDIDFKITVESSQVIAFQLPAQRLHLFSIEQFASNGNSEVRQVSTIRTGTLYMQSVAGEAQRLRPAEGVRFAESSGEIRQLELARDHVRLQFQGRVHGMTSGSGDVRRSMMPSVLQWLQAQHGLSLLWVTTAYVFGLLYTALRWWRRSS